MAGDSTATDAISSLEAVTKDAKGSVRESAEWLSSNAKGLVGKDPSIDNEGDKFPKDMDKAFLSNKMSVSSIGRMMMYIYDPKHKKTLPYYDTLPLILLLEFVPGGWTGLNLHYVPPLLRVKILESLEEVLNKTNINSRRKIQLSYQILKKSSQFEALKPCFKRYLYSQVRSSFLYVDPKDWKKAVMLPTERFRKATKSTVFKNSTAATKRPRRRDT